MRTAPARMVVGFTMIELLVSVSVGSLVVSGLLYFWIEAMDTMRTMGDRGSLWVRSQSVADQIGIDLRDTVLTSATVPGDRLLEFRRASNGTTYSYYVSGSDLYRVAGTSPSGGSVLAAGIESSQSNASVTSGVVRIKIQLKSGYETATFTVSSRPRN